MNAHKVCWVFSYFPIFILNSKKNKTLQFHILIYKAS